MLVPSYWVGLLSWCCKPLHLCHYRPQEKKPSIQNRLLILLLPSLHYNINIAV